MDTIQYNTIQYNTIQYNTNLYSAMSSLSESEADHSNMDAQYRRPRFKRTTVYYINFISILITGKHTPTWKCSNQRSLGLTFRLSSAPSTWPSKSSVSPIAVSLSCHAICSFQLLFFHLFERNHLGSQEATRC